MLPTRSFRSSAPTRLAVGLVTLALTTPASLVRNDTPVAPDTAAVHDLAPGHAHVGSEGQADVPAEARPAPPADDGSVPAIEVDEPLPDDVVLRDLIFPVLGPTEFFDDWNACRGGPGCPRHHRGTDLLGVPLQPLLAVRDAVVSRVLVHRGISGHGIELTDAEGWSYAYYHLHDDAPGTPGSSRWAVPEGLTVGTAVRAGQVIGFMGDSGNAEGSPHLHFELRMPDGRQVNPFPSLVAAEQSSRCRGPFPVPGGSLVVDLPSAAREVLQVGTLTGRGSWLLDAAGGATTAGDAALVGSPRRPVLPCPEPLAMPDVLAAAAHAAAVAATPAPVDPAPADPAPVDPAPAATDAMPADATPVAVDPAPAG